ncbi:hypothetical protein NIES2101_02495 [Calothrix sp. HK-06]|nr:hypothetical protein NIES2101_02495 [Calothrix sp. HK-06]
MANGTKKRVRTIFSTVSHQLLRYERQKMYQQTKKNSKILVPIWHNKAEKYVFSLFFATVPRYEVCRVREVH